MKENKTFEVNIAGRSIRRTFRIKSSREGKRVGIINRRRERLRDKSKKAVSSEVWVDDRRSGGRRRRGKRSRIREERSKRERNRRVCRGLKEGEEERRKKSRIKLSTQEGREEVIRGGTRRIRSKMEMEKRRRIKGEGEKVGIRKAIIGERKKT